MPRARGPPCAPSLVFSSFPRSFSHPSSPARPSPILPPAGPSFRPLPNAGACVPASSPALNQGPWRRTCGSLLSCSPMGVSSQSVVASPCPLALPIGLKSAPLSAAGVTTAGEVAPSPCGVALPRRCCQTSASAAGCRWGAGCLPKPPRQSLTRRGTCTSTPRPTAPPPMPWAPSCRERCMAPSRRPTGASIGALKRAPACG